MLVPLKVTRVALDVLQVCQDLASIANPNLLSDVAVAAVLAEATFACGRINVEINLEGLTDAEMAASTERDLDTGQGKAARLKAGCLDAIKARK
jgi:formiminotetrahydrofolate cyclodeaminase